MLIDTTITDFPITKAWEKGQLAIKEGRRVYQKPGSYG